MGKVLFLTLLIVSLSSCTNQESKKEVVEHSYDEVIDQSISWLEIFSISEKDYLLYFYSETCPHCQEIKNEIIEYSLSVSEPFYFVKESEGFVYRTNIEDTIQVSTLEFFFIKGTPTLVEIKDKKVNKNIAGVTKIRDYIS